MAKWTVSRTSDKNGFRGISICDERGHFVANMVMQPRDNEADLAKFIVDAVNEKIARQDEDARYEADLSTHLADIQRRANEEIDRSENVGVN